MDHFSKTLLHQALNPNQNLRKQIVDRIILLRESLAPGPEVRLPTSRQLAKIYQTCHITVYHAYRRLKEKGIIIVRGSRTYLVPLIKEEISTINQFSGAHEEPSGYRRLATFLPARLDVAILEMRAEPNLGTISDKMHKAVYSRARGKLAGVCSEKVLSEQIVQKLHALGLYTEMENIFIPGRGTALKAVAAAILERDDLVVMESEQDACPYTIFRSLGCEVAVTGSEEEHGMDMEALQEICRSRKVRAVFIRPDSSWPLGMITSERNRDRLIELSKAYNFRIIAYEFESEYAMTNLPRRLSVKQHAGRVVFVSVVSRASRLWEQAGFVVAEAGLVRVLKENDALLDGPRCRSMDQIAIIMHKNGSLCTEANKLVRGHSSRIGTISNLLEARLAKRARVIEPSCGRFIVIQLHQPIHVKHLASLSVNQNLNYHERNNHLKEDQTVSCLRIEYTVFNKAEWVNLANALTEILL